MNTIFRKCACAAMLGVMIVSPLLVAQTPGSVNLTATINDLGAKSGTSHDTVAWVTTSAGVFIKTLWKQGDSTFSATGGDWDHFAAWNTARSGSAAFDGYTSATAKDYATTYVAPATRANNPVSVNWNCRDASNTLVADGDYKFWIQYAESISGSGPVTTGLTWTKRTTSFSTTYPNQGTQSTPSGGSNFTGMSVTWTPAAPEIAVEQPVGTNIADAGTKAFVSVAVGSSTSLTFTVKNTGTVNLTGLTVSKDGSNPSEFTVTSNPVAPVAGPSGTTSFIVSFAPAAAGTRSAAIHIASNDSDESPFDINLTGIGTAPEIAVEQPAGTNIADAGSKDFSSVALGSNRSLTFTIKNTGTANLTGLTVTKDGTNPADFAVTSNPVSPVAGPNGTTTLVVSFAPTATGARTAAIHIANNDSDEAPFDINVSGTGITVFEDWATAAGLPPNQAAPLQTPQNDGVTNLEKFAFNMNPAAADVRRLTVGGNGTAGLPGGATAGGVLRIEFVRRKASTNPGVVYTPQFSANIGSWDDFAGAPVSVTSIDPTWERVVVDDPVAGSGKRFGRVRVAQP